PSTRRPGAFESALSPIGPSVLAGFALVVAPLEGRAGAGPASHRRSVASRRIPSMVAPSLAASWKTTYRFTMSRSDSAPGRGELSLGRSPDPRRTAKARNRHFGTHGLAVSARPPDNTVTNLADVLREPPRLPGVYLDGDVVVRNAR